jgi:hypothetical protein
LYHSKMYLYMKRNFIITVLTLWLLPNGMAQVADPVKWAFSYEITGEMEADLIFKATIQMPWHLYSAYLPEGGPIATKPYFEASDSYTLVDGIVEVTKPKIKFDEGFRMEVGTISGRAEFRQKVRFSTPGNHTINGEIEYQVCDDATCLPPKNEAFSFNLAFEGVEALATGPSQPGLIGQAGGGEDTIVEEHVPGTTLS